MINQEPHTKALLNLSDQYNKQQKIVNVILSLMEVTQYEKHGGFYDKELDERVGQLITFFIRKYTDEPTCKIENNSVSETPIFHLRRS